MAPDGRILATVTTQPHDVLDYAWSSRGQLAFTSMRAGNPDIYATVWYTAGEVQLTSDSLAQNDPAWSPDGKRVAYMSHDGIHVIAKDGTGDQWVPNSNYLGYGLAWSPDGQSLALATLDQGHFDIVKTAPDGTGRVNLTRSPGEDVDPAWEP
jgi:Tol biopolymer transport system component